MRCVAAVWLLAVSPCFVVSVNHRWSTEWNQRHDLGSKLSVSGSGLFAASKLASGSLLLSVPRDAAICGSNAVEIFGSRAVRRLQEDLDEVGVSSLNGGLVLGLLAERPPDPTLQ